MHDDEDDDSPPVLTITMRADEDPDSESSTLQVYVMGGMPDEVWYTILGTAGIAALQSRPDLQRDGLTGPARSSALARMTAALRDLFDEAYVASLELLAEAEGVDLDTPPEALLN